MARRREPPQGAGAVVNLTWLARALEDGAGLQRSLVEVYGAVPEVGLAADLRSVLVLIQIAKGGAK